MKARAGFTLLEMLVVLGIMGILMGVGVATLRPPTSYLFANDLKAMIQQARFEAIKRNVPVAVVWNSTNQTFSTRLHPSDATINAACSGTTVLNSKRPADYRNVSVHAAFTQNGVVWLPSGSGVQCGGGLMINGTTVTDGRTAHRVIISAAGRVKIEKRTL